MENKTRDNNSWMAKLRHGDRQKYSGPTRDHTFPVRQKFKNQDQSHRGEVGSRGSTTYHSWAATGPSSACIMDITLQLRPMPS